MNHIVKEQDSELYHYGVVGMKWGIRRNARVLANNRRNRAAKKINNDYELGKISRSQKKAALNKIDAKKKQSLDNIKTTLKYTKNKRDLEQIRKDISRQTVNEVPSYKLKKGLTTVNSILTGATIAGGTISGIGAAAAASMAVPGLGALALGNAAVSTLASVGVHRLAQLGIDRLS